MGGFLQGLQNLGSDLAHKPRTQRKKASSSSSQSPIWRGAGIAGPSEPSSYKRGGKVRKTGRAKVHKGERVLTKAQARKYDRRKRA